MSKNGALQGRVALITGGASGIGRALGEELASRGSDVVLADVQRELAEEVAEGIRRDGGRATATALDVRDFTSVQQVVGDTVSRAGRIDYFFNNAGISVSAEMSDYAVEDWDDVIDVNLRGVTNGIQAVYPVMIRQQSGHIVNTASMAGLTSVPAGSYSATKWGVVGLSRALCVEAKRHGVRVSVLCPGAIRTPILTGGKFGRVKVPGVTDAMLLERWERFRPMAPREFARQALAALLRNEMIIVLPRWWKPLWYLERISPELSIRLWRMMWDRMREDMMKEITGRT